MLALGRLGTLCDLFAGRPVCLGQDDYWVRLAAAIHDQRFADHLGHARTGALLDLWETQTRTPNISSLPADSDHLDELMGSAEAPSMAASTASVSPPWPICTTGLSG